MEKSYYLGDTIRSRQGAVNSDSAKIRNGWSKLSDLLPQINSRGLPFAAKARLKITLCKSSIKTESPKLPSQLNISKKVD